MEKPEVFTHYPKKEELSQIEYRSKIEIEGQVRIIEIPGYDCCACCAPHVTYTGEIGLIKLVQAQRYKGGSADHYAVRSPRVFGLCEKGSAGKRNFQGFFVRKKMRLQMRLRIWQKRRIS